jgi:peptidoglycan/xylan/chitin deacetylase (PgdA/CDA1 family)
MKRLWAMLGILLCLTACTGEPEQISEASARQTAESWGITIEETTPSPSSSPSSSPSPTNASAPETAQEQTPEPTQTPESLRELIPDTIAVYVDGKPMQGLILSDTTLILESEAAQILDLPNLEDLTWQDWGSYDGQGGVAFQEETWLPVRWLSQKLDMELLWDQEQAAVYLTHKIGTIPENQNVPVLMYHAVSDDLWGIASLFVSPADLEAQIQYLLNAGYTPIFFSDLPNVEHISKPILLTFDDGYDDNYTYLFPLLQQYGVKATCFIITGMLGDEYYLTSQQVREMSDSGLVDIQSHTVDHDELETLSREDQEYQVSQSRLDIARITGKLPMVLAYPSGSRNSDTLSLAEQYYGFGIDMNGGTWNTSGSRYQVDRIYISRYDTLDDFINKVP